MPWLILLGPIHIALHPRLRHRWVHEPLDGLLDIEAFLVMQNPPPNRPVLILVDFSPLQALTHRSEPDREHYMAMASSNFRNVSGYELEALFYLVASDGTS